MSLDRREFIASSAKAAFIGLTVPSLAGEIKMEKSKKVSGPLMKDIRSIIKDPVIISSIDVVETQKERFVIARSADGATGITLVNFRLEFLIPFMKGMVVPYFLNKDARDLESIIDQMLHDRRIYKYSGIPLFNCVGHVEISILDLLGKIAGVPCGTFFGNIIRKDVPVYLSSLTRETTPEEEAAWLKEKLEITGAKAVKIKVGGRNSRNQDAMPGRTKNLVPLVRKVLGDDITIYADANSSYDAKMGIEVARMLEDNGVKIFEEPCPWEDYASNKKVADSLRKMKLAGGEQDTSYMRFKDIIDNKVYHVLQPDLYYNGGMLRCQMVAKMAEAANLSIAPHSPKADPLAAPFLQFASIATNLEGFQEYPGAAGAQASWYTPHILVKDGKVEVPSGSGLGLQYDTNIFKNAVQL